MSSKDKKADGLVQLPHNIEDQAVPLALPTPTFAANGAEPRKRHEMSTPLQVVARFERDMAKLNDRERRRVMVFLLDTYNHLIKLDCP